MMPTDRPRFHLCPRCVRLRGLEADARFSRVAVDVGIRGPCDDCADVVDDLEAWRPKDLPEPRPTLRAIEDPDPDLAVVVNVKGETK